MWGVIMVMKIDENYYEIMKIFHTNFKCLPVSYDGFKSFSENHDEVIKL